MKHKTRLLALSALVLAVMLAALGVPALEAPGVAFAQGQVPAAPTGLTATRSGASTINLSWNAVSGAVRYQVYSWDAVDKWQRLDGGEANPHTTTTFSHQNLVADRLYYYQVYGVNSNGDRGPRSNRANEVAGQNAPARPALTATPGYLLNVISWPTVPGATSYVLYAWDNTWSQVGGTLTNPTYTHTGLTAGQTYYYEARATNANGVMGAYSAQVGATVLSTPTVTAPVSLSAGTRPEDQQVTLTWQSPPGAGSTITGYQYRYAESTATLPDTWSDAGTDMTETITGLTNGTQYTFQVRAMSSTGEGPPASVMATPAAVPDAPVLTATEGYRLVTLSWDAPANNGAAITAYHVETLNAQNQWVAVPSSLSGTATSYTIRNLNDSTVYTYRIIAENAAGRSSASNSADATTLAQPAQAPGPPTTIGSEAPGPGSITITWQAPLTTGGSPITRYEYRYAAADDTDVADISWSRWMSAMTELKVTVMDLTPDDVYSLEVRAVNSAGAGMAANTDGLDDAVRTPGPTGPTAVPQNVRASLDDFGTAVEPHETNAEITVSWDVVPDSANGGANITGYELCYKKSTDSAWKRWDTDEPAFGDPSDAGTVRTAVHGTATGMLEPGTIYQYRVRALNSVALAGPDTCDSDVEWSREVSAQQTPIVKPAAPMLHPAAGDTGQSAWTLNVNSITIRWTAPTVDGGADITGYEVWVGTTMVPDSDIATISPTVTNLPPSRTEYISIGLTPSTSETEQSTYYYRVRARNGTGDSRVGAWSDEVSGATLVTQSGTPGAPAAAPTISVTQSSGDVAVSWAAPANQGSTPITSYEVQYQRVDDEGTEADQITADTADWSDAAIGTPTPPTALMWTHMQAPGNSDYVYRVRAVNGSGPGAWSPNSDAADVMARGPDAPELTATALNDEEIMLQWNIPEANGTDIAGFAIQQWDPTAESNAGAWTDTNLLATGGPADNPDISDEPTLTVFIVDDGLVAGTKYYFRIQALLGGDWSAMADAASATTTAGTPAMPTLNIGDGTTQNANNDPAAAAPTDDTITLWWNAPPDGGSDITGYQLRVWDGSEWVIEDSPAAGATMYTDEGLEPGTRYYYILAATNSTGYGPWSAAASAMTDAGNPDAPALTAVATGADSIQLSWNVPNANGATITGYQLVRWTGTAWGGDNLLTGAVLADEDAETVTEFEDTTDLAAGTKYYYRIRALPQSDDDSGWSAMNTSDATSATTHGDTPGRPTWVGDFTATASSLALNWAAPTATGGSAITGYELEIWSGGRWVDEDTLGASISETEPEYTDMNLAAGTKYYYRVRAINSQGAGLWSATEAGTTSPGTPDAPVLTATATGMTTIRLTWTVPDDNGVAGGITGYVLQRWDPDTEPANWSSTIGPEGDGNLLPATATVTLFVDSALDSGTTYYYRIRAEATADGGWSTIKSATTVAGAPGRPATVTAEADGQNAIDITWTAAPANGSAIVRYELQVWNTATSMWDTVRNDLPSTRLSYKHSGLTADTRYVYRVRGVNRAADNNGLGKWSVITFANTAK